MILTDWLMIIAILLAPLVALQVQQYIDYFRSRKNRKMRIFETLMTTRREQVSQYHVQALNMIDIDFYGIKIFGLNWRTKKEKNVLTSWKTYLDHLNTPGELTDTKLENWVNRKDELFTDLLYDISQAVGYEFDKVHLKRSIYTPRAHGDQILDNELIRQNLVKILNGEKPLPMKLVVEEETHNDQKYIQSRFKDLLDGKTNLGVEIIKNDNETDQDNIEEKSH